MSGGVRLAAGIAAVVLAMSALDIAAADPDPPNDRPADRPGVILNR